jgi:hypothetical protein
MFLRLQSFDGSGLRYLRGDRRDLISMIAGKSGPATKSTRNFEIKDPKFYPRIGSHLARSSC